MVSCLLAIASRSGEAGGSVVERQKAVKVTVLMIEYNGLRTTDKGQPKKGGKEHGFRKCQRDFHEDAGGF